MSALEPPAVYWDPTEELAHLLGEAIEETHALLDPPEQVEPIPDAANTSPELADHAGSGADGEEAAAGGVNAADLSPVRQVGLPRRTRPRRRRPRYRLPGGLLRLTSLLIAAAAAALVCGVCIFSGVVSYQPLREVAVHHTDPFSTDAWPLLVYGPWTVASLSVLRAGLHRRRAAHSWAVVLLFSLVAMALCITQAAPHPLDAATAALPAVAALACFQQLMRQITLSRPPRQTRSRHRTRSVPRQQRRAPKPPSVT
ncbi:DUF2637 domain-containing protein [Streptomyces sp. SGAir0957]